MCLGIQLILYVYPGSPLRQSHIVLAMTQALGAHLLNRDKTMYRKKCFICESQCTRYLHTVHASKPAQVPAGSTSDLFMSPSVCILTVLDPS